MEWNKTHGLYKTPEYRAWCDLLGRCRRPTHPSYRHYGGRGIRVDPRWMDFATFYEDMGPRPSAQHSIDRQDNNGPYTKANCRWATRLEQMANQRKTRLLTYNGETLHVREWARRVGVSHCAILHRLRRGWTIEQVLQPATRVELTKAQRAAVRADTRPQWQVGADYGVSQMTVSRIKRRVRGHP